MERPCRWRLPVALAGWRGAYVVPCLSLLAGGPAARPLAPAGGALAALRPAAARLPAEPGDGSGRDERRPEPVPRDPRALALLARQRAKLAVVAGVGLRGRWLDAVSREQPDSIRPVLRRRVAAPRAQRLGARRGRNCGPRTARRGEHLLPRPTAALPVRLHPGARHAAGAPADLRPGAARLRAGRARAGAALSRAALAGAMHRGGGLRDRLPDPDVLHVHDVGCSRTWW